MLQRLLAMIVGRHIPGGREPAGLAPLEAFAPMTGERDSAPAAGDASSQAQKMETIGRCVGEFAHDFNNLLQVIIGNLDRAARSAVPGSKPHDCLADARMATERAASLVGRILAFSRGQAASSSLIDIDGTIAALRPLIASITAGCAVDIEFGCGGWQCRAEANQLEHAVLNLVLNARDAMPDGGFLTLKTFAVRGSGPAEGAGDQLALMVADTGIGMSSDVAARAFEPFFTTKPAGRGTGLGLAQIAGFVQRAAGSAQIDSAPGRGTRVTLLLPRAVPEPHETLGPSADTCLSASCPLTNSSADPIS